MRGRVNKPTRSVLLACIMLAWSSCVFALNPALDITQYAHTSWKIRDGFSKGQPYSIAQTPDGYLWLGTEFGLLRFDGVRAVPWQPQSGEHLPSDSVGALLAARDGTLWIGTSKGLASLQNNKLTLWLELAGQGVTALLEDHAGQIWVGGIGIPSGRLCTIRQGKADCSGQDGSIGLGVMGLYEDSQTNIWVGQLDGIIQWASGRRTFYSLPGNPDGIQSIAEDTEGALLIATSDGIRRLVDGKMERPSLAVIPQPSKVACLLRDREGSLWIGTKGHGLLHIHQGRTDVFGSLDGLSSDRLWSLFEDREGNIWVANKNGLDRFRDVTVSTFSAKQGFADSPNTVLAASDGSLWLTATDGLFRFLNRQFTIFGGSNSRLTPANLKRRQRLNGPFPGSLFEDARGRLWVSTQGGIGYVENERFTPISGIPGGSVHSIGADKSGNIWIANQNSGLYQLSTEGKVKHIQWSDLGHKDFANAIAADPVRNGIWLGFYQGGIAYYEDGQIRASYTAANGLGNGNVLNFRFDPDGTIWIATEGGLSRLRNGQVATLNSKDGLPCDGVQWVTEDDDHSFWLDMPCGLVRIMRTEVDAWATSVDKRTNEARMVETTLFDSSDGMRSLLLGGGYSPVAAKSPDGKLWFKAGEGISVVDPRHLPFNKLPPPVHIEQVTADRKLYDVAADNNGSLRLPALSRDLEIDYTALSFVAPEKNRFRYKLEGYDKDWQEAGNRRQAFYTNLRPGNYTFRVIACNNNGVWNETGAALSFYIKPAFYQTYWFLALCLLAVAGIVWLLYVARVRRMAAIYKGRMEERIGERERIARDLHDTFLQSVQGLILTFDAAAKQIPAEQPARQSMENALDRADEVMAEGRERVRNLRDNIPLSDLPAAFAHVADEISNDQITFKTVVEGRSRSLNPLVVEETYAIGREAILNAFTHSGGSQVEAEITFDRRQFRVRIRDDGRGIDPQILKEGERPDHFGLQGMRERASRVGAQLNLWSGAEKGTEVELLVPAKTAYQVTTSKPDRFWQRRSLDGE